MRATSIMAARAERWEIRSERLRQRGQNRAIVNGRRCLAVQAAQC